MKAHAIPRNWRVTCDRSNLRTGPVYYERLRTGPVYYERDNESTSEAIFTAKKDQAQAFTLDEAETMVAGLSAQGYIDMMVSAGGEA